MNNFQLWELINFIIGKDIQSNRIKPEQFDLELKACNVRLLRKRLGFPESYQPGQTTSGPSASRLLETDLKPFFEGKDISVANGIATIQDWFYIEDFYVSGASACEIISRQEISNRLLDPQLAPSTKYVAAHLVKQGLKVYPSTITSIHVFYIRQPNTPAFAVKTGTNLASEYDTTNSIELEWDESGKIDIIQMILKDMGINTERQNIVAYADQLIKTGA